MDYKSSQDLARVRCAACDGCGDCCRGMGDSIHLDPYDFWMLEKALGRSALAMYHDIFDFHVEDGLYLPHLLMKNARRKPITVHDDATGDDVLQYMPYSEQELKLQFGLAQDDSERLNECVFLDADGRCQIHESRPGMCRLFPMGRNYKELGFDYFVIPDGCDMPNKSKVRIEDYLEIPDLKKYEMYISDWHRFVRKLQAELVSKSEDERVEVAQKVVHTFFISDYIHEEDFFMQYMRRQMEFYRK